MSLFSIIINVTDGLPGHLSSLERLHVNPAETPLEIITVGGIHESPSPSFRHIACDADAGMRRSVGANNARGEFLVFLDSNVIPEEKWLPSLAAVLKADRGISGGLICHMSDNTVHHAGIAFNDSTSSFYHIYHHFDRGFHGINKTREFPAVSAGCMMVKRDVFLNVGAFGAGTFSSIDFCLKARRCGWKTVYTPRCLAVVENPLEDEVVLKVASCSEYESVLPVIERDDTYFREDGLRMSFSPDGSIQLEELFTQSYALVDKALRFSATGRFEDAEARLRESLDLFPGNQDAWTELARLHMRTGKFEEALEDCEKLMSIEPPLEQARILKAEIFLAQNEKAKAKRLLEEVYSDSNVEDSVRKEARSRLRALGTSC